MIDASAPLLHGDGHCSSIPEHGIDQDRVAFTGAAAIKLRIVEDLDVRQEVENFWIGQPGFRK